MDIKAEKLNLIKWLTEVEEPTVIEQFLNLKNNLPANTRGADWWDEISAQEKEEIQEGFVQADKNEFTRHEDVMAKYQKWRLK